MFKRLNQQVIRLLFFAYIFFVLYMCVYVHESVQVPVCVRVCTHVCVYCMHSCVFVCVCTYLCYRSHQVSFLIASTLFLETGTLTGVGAIDLARLGWLVCSSDSPVFSPDNHWAYRRLLFCLTFSGCWEAKLRSSSLQGSTLMPSPSLQPLPLLWVLLLPLLFSVQSFMC